MKFEQLGVCIHFPSFPQNILETHTHALYQPAWFSATNALYLITSNLSLGAVVTHVALYHWSDMKPFFLSLNPWNKTPQVINDEHYQKMKVYKPIPRYWFFAILAAAYGIAQATNYTGHSGLPWWALTVLAIISFVFCALYGMLAATIGFYEFSSSGTGFFQMITGQLFLHKAMNYDVDVTVQHILFLAVLLPTCTEPSTANIP